MSGVEPRAESTQIGGVINGFAPIVQDRGWKHLLGIKSLKSLKPSRRGETMIKIKQKKGKYQVQLQEGKSKVIALTGWISKKTAQLVRDGLGQPYRKPVCHICGKEYNHCRCGWGN